MPRLPTAFALACLLLAGDAFAWSAEGHRVVAHIADAALSPAARAEVDRLLADEPDPTLAGVSTWADELRDTHPTAAALTAKWHYINFDGRCDFHPPRDCKGDQCVVTQANLLYQVLADPTQEPAARTNALKYLVHLVADLHQPLHAGPRDDKGGNDYQVNLGGEGTNLHRIWDGTIPARRGLAAREHADALLEELLPADATLHSDRPVLEWALESCRLVEEGRVYPSDGRHVIDEAFLDERLPLAEQRLHQAGVRLAKLLNHALAPPRQAP